ncbi:MAG TPA: YceI family protein [Bacteroidia bacterium]|jgi:polyisoprenoid-binding protein YceI|nr:YceI family protein [Bacteroidia bacterium]
MKKIIIFAITFFFFLAKNEAQIYMADSCRVNFFSAATIEDITADNTSSKPVMSSATGDIQMSLTNEDFIFKKKLMQEHFNEDYMESDKYPHTIFKGKVNEKVDYTKDGVNNVTVTGTMNMHGVQKNITIPGTLTIKNGIIFLSAKFNVKVADYKIKVPSLLGNDIAESVAITFNATMKPYKVK